MTAKSKRLLSGIVTGLRYAVVIVCLCALPIPWHEIVGHGLAGIFCGGRVTRFQLFGWQFVPDFRWIGTRQGLGECDHAGITPGTCIHLTNLAGSMSTFVVGAAAACALWRYRPRGLRRAALVCLTLWSTDLLTFTLPSFGVRRYIWSGTRYSEPYKAALGLGIPGPLFQAFVLIAFAAVVIVVACAIIRRPNTRASSGQ